jgi:small subunit ribosomal protein S9
MKAVHTSGKRKRSIARATLKPGNGIVRFNHILIDNLHPKMARMKLREPLILAEDVAVKVDIDVNVHGGGFMSQADAGRLAIAKALVEYTKDSKLEKRFQEYDRQMLVADVRRKETRKPNDSRARAARQKSYR